MGWLSLIVSDAAALFPEYTEAGAEFTQNLADKPWSNREFGVRAIDGHGFGEAPFKPNPPIGFVQRFSAAASSPRSLPVVGGLISSIGDVTAVAAASYARNGPLKLQPTPQH